MVRWTLMYTPWHKHTVTISKSLTAWWQEHVTDLDSHNSLARFVQSGQGFKLASSRVLAHLLNVGSRSSRC